MSLRERGRIVWCTPGIGSEGVLLDSVRAAGWVVSRQCIDAVDVLASVSIEANSIVVASTHMQRVDSALWSDLCSRAAAIIVLQDDYATAIPRGSHHVIELTAHGDCEALLDALESAPRQPLETQGAGAVVAVWGTAGAPGRTTVAVAMSEAAAHRGLTTILIDGDTHNPSMACALAITEQFSGLLLACKHAEQGSLDESTIQRALRTLKPNLDVLTGLDDPSRWPEVRSDPCRRVLRACRLTADLTVVDIHSSTELNADPITGMQGERNGVTRVALSEADRIIVVARPDPVGVSRLARSLGHLAELALDQRTLVLVNRIHRSSDVREVQRVVQRLGFIADVEGVPDDPMVRRAAIRGSLPGELARRSRARTRLRRVTRDLLAA